jgi:hypothetical protein
MIGVGVALGLLLIATLTVGALALRPRETARAQAPLPDPAARAEVQPTPAANPLVKSEPGPEAPGKALAPADRADKPSRALPQTPPAPVEAARDTPELPPPVELVLDPTEDPPAPPAKAPPEVAGAPEPGCGTAVAFVASPVQAARRAADEGKLLFTLHVSGNFEDPGFT